MGFNANIQKAVQSTAVSLNGVTTGTTTSAAGLVLNIADSAHNVEFESLVANVSCAITTTSLVVVTKWQVSNDNVTWVDLYMGNAPAYVGVAAAGTGGAVVTAYAQHLPINPSYPYVRMAVKSTAATGGAADIITISYNFRKRSLVGSG